MNKFQKNVILQGRQDIDDDLEDWAKEVHTLLEFNFEKYKKNALAELTASIPSGSEKPGWTAVMVSDIGFETNQYHVNKNARKKRKISESSSSSNSDVTVWMTGREQYGNGESVCIWIENAMPYFYVGISHPDPLLTEVLAKEYEVDLFNFLKTRADKSANILNVRAVKRRWFYGYKPDSVRGDKKTPSWPGHEWSGDTTQASDWYLKVYLNTPYQIYKARKWALEWVKLQEVWRLPIVKTTSTIMAPVDLVIFEANVEFDLRFMIDRGLVGCGWCVIDESRCLDVVQTVKHRSAKSRCSKNFTISADIFEQAELARDLAFINGDDIWEAVRLALVDCPIRFVARESSLQKFVDGVGPGTEHEDPMQVWFDLLRTKTSNLRIMSFDIECCNPHGSFPQPNMEDDQVINIAARIYDLHKIEAYERRRPVELALKAMKKELKQFLQNKNINWIWLLSLTQYIDIVNLFTLSVAGAAAAAAQEDIDIEAIKLLLLLRYHRSLRKKEDIRLWQSFKTWLLVQKEHRLQQNIVKKQRDIVNLGIDGLGHPAPVLQHLYGLALERLKKSIDNGDPVLESTVLRKEVMICKEKFISMSKRKDILVVDTTLSCWPPPLHAVVMGLGTREPMLNGGIIDGYPVQSFSFSVEEELLVAFAKQILVWDPDIIEGYNSVAFDMAYLLRRADFLGIKKVFWDLGRLPGRLSIPKQVSYGNKARGKMKEWRAQIHGRIQFDIYKCCSTDGAYKVRSYTLNNVAHDLLGQAKLDMPYEDIPKHHFGTPATRRKLDEYCDVDALLPFGIDRKQKYLMRNIELARVTGVSLNILLTRGQQIFVFSQLLRKARETAYAVPWLPVVEPQRDETEARRIKAYKGAIVIDPIVGYYTLKDGPVLVNDYKSLYPMLIISENLCYTTHVTDRLASNTARKHHLVHKASEDAKRLLKDKWWQGDLMIRGYEKEGGWKVAPVNSKTKKNPVFVTSEVKMGLIPQILEFLLTARAVAKKEMKRYEKGSPEYEIQNARQMALKVCCNSVYGFTGAPVGRQPDLDISGATTGYGRCALYYAAKLAVKLLPGDNKVIYGDTDSVMILLKDLAIKDTLIPNELLGAKVKLAIKKAFIRGRLLDKEVNSRLLKPMALETEKVYTPFLLLGKKKYVTLMWMHSKYAHDLDVKGIEMVRRDNPEITGKTCGIVANLLMGHGGKDPDTGYCRAVCPDVELAKTFLTEVHRRILSNLLPLEAYIISSKFSKPREEYKVPMPHAELAYRMKQRDPGSAPQLGHRVPYVIIKAESTEMVRKGRGHAKLLHERSEDPNWVKKHNLQIDTDCYAKRKFEPAFLRIMSPVLEADTLKYAMMDPGINTKQEKKYRNTPKKLEKWKKTKRKHFAETHVKRTLFSENYQKRKIQKCIHKDSPMASFLHLKEKNASETTLSAPPVSSGVDEILKDILKSSRLSLAAAATAQQQKRKTPPKRKRLKQCTLSF